jgi:hypothetical protein
VTVENLPNAPKLVLTKGWLVLWTAAAGASPRATMVPTRDEARRLKLVYTSDGCVDVRIVKLLHWLTEVR